MNYKWDNIIKAMVINLVVIFYKFIKKRLNIYCNHKKKKKKIIKIFIYK